MNTLHPKTSASSSEAGKAPAPQWEVYAAFAFVTSAVSLLYHVRGVPFLERNLAVVAAVMFLYVPALLLWRRGRELEQYGLRAQPLKKGLALYGLFVAVVLPLFVAGYFIYGRYGCSRVLHVLGSLGGRYLHCPPYIPFKLRPPPELAMTALSQLLVVALPEEFFFRGYILGRLTERFSPVRALVLSAAIFALGHYLVTFQPAALAVFFPGLCFGLLRLLTGSILAGTLFHATCNLLIDLLHRSLG